MTDRPETTDPESFADNQLERMWVDVSEVIREMFHRFPFGEKIMLANGRTGQFKKYYEPIEDSAGPTGTGWKFGIDFCFDEGSPDHYEFVTRHTGGGGAVNLTVSQPSDQTTDNRSCGK